MTRRDLLAAGVIAVAVIAVFWEAVFLQGAFFVQDVMVQNYPFRHFYSTAVKEWSLPLWHPGINCGFPLFAEGQVGILYPLNLLGALLLPTYAALNLNIVFHLWLGGVGMYIYMRTLACEQAAALCSGLIFSLSGYIVVRAMSPNYVDVYAWMPFLFLSIDLALRTNRQIYIFCAAAVTGLQFLAGHPQATVYCGVAAVLFGAYRGLMMGRSRKRLLAWVLAVPIAGSALSAVQLLPTAELVRLSGRSGGVSLEQFTNMSLPPERLITFLLPSFFGNSASGSYWGDESGFFIQLCPYLGVIPLVLCLIAVRERRDATTVFLGALTAAALLLALGRHTAVFEALYPIPGLSFFRIPTRFLLWLAFGGAALAGLGLDSLLRQHRVELTKTHWPVVAAMGVAAAGALWINGEILLASEGALGALTREVAMLAAYRDDLVADAWRCAIMLVAAAVLVGGCRRGGTRVRTVLGWLTPVVVFADLASFGGGFNGVIDSAYYERTPDSAVFIQQDAEHGEEESAVGQGARSLPAVARFRCASLISERNAPYDWHAGWARDQRSYQLYPETLRMYTASIYGLANTFTGWSPLHLRSHWEFMRGYPRFMSLANVGYVVSHRPLPLPALREIYHQQVRVYRNEATLPRAYVVPTYAVVGEARERLQYMLGPGFTPRRQVVLAHKPVPIDHGGAAGEGSAGEGLGSKVPPSKVLAQITSYEPELVEVSLTGVTRPGFLVLSDTHYPGWEARVDGAQTPVLVANHVFRAVQIDAGDRSVVFDYKPASFSLGLWVSAFSGVVLVLLMWVGRNHELWPGGSLPETDDAVTDRISVKAWSVQILLIFLLHALSRDWGYWAEMVQRSEVLSVLGGN